MTEKIDVSEDQIEPSEDGYDQQSESSANQQPQQLEADFVLNQFFSTEIDFIGQAKASSKPISRKVPKRKSFFTLEK